MTKGARKHAGQTAGQTAGHRQLPGNKQRNSKGTPPPRSVPAPAARARPLAPGPRTAQQTPFHPALLPLRQSRTTPLLHRLDFPPHIHSHNSLRTHFLQRKGQNKKKKKPKTAAEMPMQWNDQADARVGISFPSLPLSLIGADTKHGGEWNSSSQTSSSCTSSSWTTSPWPKRWATVTIPRPPPVPAALVLPRGLFPGADPAALG